MQVILDKLGAALIATTLFLMVFNVNARNGQSMTETTAFYAMTTQSEAFAKVLRRDLQGIVEVQTIEETSIAGGGTEFRFVSRIGQDTTMRTIIYRKQPFAVQRGMQFYTIERLVDGTVDGGSSDVITDWEIRALNEDAGTITDTDDTAQIYVRFEAATPMMETETVESIKWESRFFPPLRN